MLLDLDDPECALPDGADVCVLGAGAAGILLATELARGGKRVVLLEGGGLRLEARSQEIYRSVIAADGHAHRGVHEGRFRTYGGSTTRWGGQILELDAEDFAARPWVPGSGWPFGKAELTPFYERALRFEGLRQVEPEDAKVWAGLGLGDCEVGEEFRMSYSRWCPERNFAALHGRELAESQRLTVVTHANAAGFAMNAARTVIEAVEVRGFGGREVRLAAKSFVVCLGGIESVRLLLQPAAEGLLPWQMNGMLGRHYQDHIGLHGVEIRRVRSTPAQRYFGYVNLDGFRYHNKIRLRVEEQKRLATLNVAGTIGPWAEETPARERAEVLLRQVLREGIRPSAKEWVEVLGQVPGIVAARLRSEATAWQRMMLTVHCEQEPLGQSGISLSEERDRLGMLRTRLRWVVSDNELLTLRAYVRTAQVAFARTGFAEVVPPAGFFADDALVRAMCGDSYHHMGGARMAQASSEGVVDAQLRLHGVANGYVCSSAVFPCSGFSNPTHTLLALGMRLADRLLERGAEVVVAGRQEGMPVVSLPGVGTRVPQLGFGCAYLLGRVIDAARSRRLLDAAWDAGIRHYDAARLYGHGRTEALLGEFLRRHPEATVTTKYGVLPAGPGWRAWEAGARRIAAMRAVRRDDRARFTAAEARQSLETSLRALRRERVEMFLLHEPRVEDLRPELLELLREEQRRGRIGVFGVGGEFARMPELLRQRPEFAAVLQMEHSVFGPQVDAPGDRRVHYRTFARAAEVLRKALAKDALARRRWEERLGMDVEEPRVLRELLLQAELRQWPETLVLFSSGSEDHIFEVVEMAGFAGSSEAAGRLLELIGEDDLGMGKALYGVNK